MQIENPPPQTMPTDPESDSPDAASGTGHPFSESAPETEPELEPESKRGKNRAATQEITVSSSKPWVYHLFHALYFLLGGAFLIRVTGVGIKKVPRRGGCILASNHASFLDPLVTGVPFVRTLRFYARATLFKNRFFGWLISSLGAIPMDRGKSDFKALRKVVEMIRNGDAVQMFPEGTRTVDGELQSFKPGVASIAILANCPVFPVYLHGTYETWSRKVRRFKLFHKHWVLVGDPVHPSDFPEEMPEREKKRAIMEELVNRMKALEQEARSRWPLRDYHKAGTAEIPQSNRATSGKQETSINPA